MEPSSALTRCASACAAMRRGCVWPIMPADAAPQLEADLRQLRALAAAGGAADDRRPGERRWRPRSRRDARAPAGSRRSGSRGTDAGAPATALDGARTCASQPLDLARIDRRGRAARAGRSRPASRRRSRSRQPADAPRALRGSGRARQPSSRLARAHSASSSARRRRPPACGPPPRARASMLAEASLELARSRRAARPRDRRRGAAPAARR